MAAVFVTHVVRDPGLVLGLAFPDGPTGAGGHLFLGLNVLNAEHGAVLAEPVPADLQHVVDRLGRRGVEVGVQPCIVSAMSSLHPSRRGCSEITIK